MKFFEGDELGGPFDLIFNLPLHPLVVHGAVVLVPLVAFSALAMSYWPSFSRKYGGPVLILAVIAQLSLFVAKASGEPFQQRLNKDIERHANFGEIAPLTFIPLLALLFIRWRMDKSGANVGSPRVRRVSGRPSVVPPLRRSTSSTTRLDARQAIPILILGSR